VDNQSPAGDLEIHLLVHLFVDKKAMHVMAFFVI